MAYKMSMRRTRFKMIRTRFNAIKYTRKLFPHSIENNLNLVKKIAWNFHQTSGLDVDDLYMEGCYAYIQAIKKWDPLKSKCSTFIWHSITNHLINYLKQWGQAQFIQLEIDKGYFQESVLENLTIEGQQMASIIFTIQNKFIHLNEQQATTRLVQICSNQGWDSHKIQIGLHSLKTTFNGHN